MSAAGVIVVDVLSQDSPEVPLVEDDHVVETLAANATHHPFDVRILPWRARRRPNLVDAESRDAPAEVRSIDSISVSQHEARSTLPGKGIDDLLRGPLCRRVVCDIEVSDPSPIVTEYDEDEENSKRGGWQREEIDGDQVLNVVVEKAPPRLRRWFSMPNHVHGHRGLGNGDAELRELAVHARRSPQRIGSAHVPDQLPHLQGNTRPTGPTFPTLPSPIASEPSPVPPDNGLRFHDDEHVVPVRPDSAQQHPEAAIEISEPRPFHGTLEDGELLAKGEILKRQRATRLERRDE